jgi:UDP-N-acetylmuramoyl-tripeptide--D-alanyl-D-alanine ligase
VGDLFVALIAERDGHDFIPNALQKSAGGLLISRESVIAPNTSAHVVTSTKPQATTEDSHQPELHNYIPTQIPADIPVLCAPDTLRALGDLAAGYRRQFDSCRVVGVTGSNGKTTCKEMLRAMMSQLAPTLATAGNFNNLIGLPLTLFGLQNTHQYAILEMGMNAPGEIARLAQIAQPELGIITCVAPAHLEGLGSIEGVAKAKGELFAALPHNGIAIINADDHHILHLAKDLISRKIYYSANMEGQIPIAKTEPLVSLSHIQQLGVKGFHFQAQIANLPPDLARNLNPSADAHHTTINTEISVDLPLIGRHQVSNALAAISAAIALGATKTAIVEGLRQIQPTGRRMRLTTTDADLHLLDDCYNSNPLSCKAALLTIAELGQNALRIAVIGDMLELGENEYAEHAEIGKFAANIAISHLLTFGPRSKATAQAAVAAGLEQSRVQHYCDIDALWDAMLPLLQPHSWILIKASRGMKLERISQRIENYRPQNP